MANQSKSSLRLCIVALGFWLCAVPFVHADTLLYKWIDKDGVVSYSQYMPTEGGAHNVNIIKIETLPVAQQRAANRVLAQLEKLSDMESAIREKRLAAADQRIEKALARLQQTEKKLSDGTIPTGDDRVGNVGGHARLRDTYFERISQLQVDVNEAQQTLSNAYAARDQP